MPNKLPASFIRALKRHGNEPGTLAADIVTLIEERRRDGLTEPTIRGGYIYPAAALLRHLRPGLRSDELTVDVLRDYVTAALEAGYAPRTVSKQHLGLVRMTLQGVGLRDITREVRRRMASALAPRSLPPEVFSPEELRALFQRVISYRSRHYLPSRWKHLAIFRLAGMRAIRALELSRVQIETDVDLERGQLYVRKAKVAAHPRVVQLSAVLVEDVAELAGDRTEGPLVAGGARAIGVAVETWQRRLREPRLTMRNLRRSCASALDAQGAPLAVVRDVLGHSRDSRQTLLYLGTTRQRLRRELECLDHLADPLDSASSRRPLARTGTAASRSAVGE